MRVRPITSPRRASLYALAAVLLPCLPEFAYWAGAMACPVPGFAAESCGVLVLGFPSYQDGTPHPMQRHRVGTAAEIMKRSGCKVMVISGGNPHSSISEADIMAGLASASGIPTAKMVLERRSLNTWENIRYSLGDIESLETIYLVSDSLHVHRARRYLCRQRPDLCARTRSAARYSPGKFYGLKWLGMLHEARNFARDSVTMLK